MLQTTTAREGAADFDKFRLRRFAEHLVAIGEADVHAQPIAMADLAAAIAETPRAMIFRDAGPEHFEIVAAAAGSRKRLAAALGVDERDAGKAYLDRLGKPQPVIEVASEMAPVHQVVRKGDDVDLTRLPFHLQHEFDGGVYISASIDYAVDPVTGKRNVGCRRLMLRSRDTLRANLTDASDLKLMYLACLKRGERLPVSYVIGAHPLDYLAATQKQPVDEFALVGTVRGEPVPMVRGVTNGILVPADAEAVIEGYFDELGYREMEGPYGEFYGYYGSMHIDPVFHATAITMRARRHVPDRAACRTVHRPHGFGEPCIAQCRGERLARAARGAARAGGDQFRAGEQRPPALPRRRSSAARRARRGSRSPRCSRCRRSSTPSSSTRTSTCFPTRRWNGRWRRGSPPTATSW